MGLDMYLTKKTYVGGKYEHRKIKGKVEIEIEGTTKIFDVKKIDYIDESQAYRKKANQIHRWFVTNVQEEEDDCKQYEVSVDQLEELVGLCEKVLASLEKQTLVEVEIDDKWSPGGKVKVMAYPNVDIAMEFLPPQEGFFFGGYSIDEYYVEDLKNTIEQLKDLDKRCDYYYQSSR